MDGIQNLASSRLYDHFIEKIPFNFKCSNKWNNLYSLLLEPLTTMNFYISQILLNWLLSLIGFTAIYIKVEGMLLLEMQTFIPFIQIYYFFSELLIYPRTT